MCYVRTAGVDQPDDGTMDGSAVVFTDGEITTIGDSVAGIKRDERIA